MGVTVLLFAAELQKERTASTLSEDWSEFQNGMYVEGGRKH